MPYADPEKRRAAQREWIRAKRQRDAEFRAAENARRAEQLRDDPEGNRAAVRRWREANPERAREQTREAGRRFRAKLNSQGE